MNKSSTFQYLLRWPLLGFALVIAASIALLTISPSIAYNANLQGEFNEPQPTADPQAGVEPWESPSLLAKASKILAHRLSVSPDDLEFVSQEAVRWPDTSLGCPEPDGRYGKVIVPGYRFTFSHDGSRYEVHTASENGVGSQLAPVSCEGAFAY